MKLLLKSLIFGIAIELLLFICLVIGLATGSGCIPGWLVLPFMAAHYPAAWLAEHQISFPLNVVVSVILAVAVWSGLVYLILYSFPSRVGGGSALVVGQMCGPNYLAKIWDFVWGAFIAGTLPVIVFWFTWVAAMIFVPMAMILCPVIAFATLFFIYKWRRQHRLLPVGFIFFEILSGLAIGVLFSVIMCRGFAHLPP